jgi:NADPH:quinone reductase-like Zn-dependent oxidoreductase
VIAIHSGSMPTLIAFPGSFVAAAIGVTVSDAGGAMLEPLGVALWALDLGHVPFGGSVAVVGGGPIGLLLIQLLRAAGVRAAGRPGCSRRDSGLGRDHVPGVTRVLRSRTLRKRSPPPRGASG